MDNGMWILFSVWCILILLYYYWIQIESNNSIIITLLLCVFLLHLFWYSTYVYDDIHFYYYCCVYCLVLCVWLYRNDIWRFHFLFTKARHGNVEYYCWNLTYPMIRGSFTTSLRLWCVLGPRWSRTTCLHSSMIQIRRYQMMMQSNMMVSGIDTSTLIDKFVLSIYSSTSGEVCQ